MLSRRKKRKFQTVWEEVKMKMQRHSFSRFFLFAFLASILALILPCPISAQDYPTKPITVYCGYEAGATTDLTARGLAAGLEKLLALRW